MKQNQLIEKITHQWPAKVICLIIAIFLYVFHQVSLIDKKTFAIPLTIIENGEYMHVGNYLKSVSVIVRTSKSNMNVISTNDMIASVNLDTIIEKGVYELPVHIEISDQLMTFDPFEIKIKQNVVTLEVEKKSMKYVEIIPSISGNVAHGYKIDSISVDPSTVLITGPESVINATNQVYTDKVNVSNAEKSFTVEANYQPISTIINLENKGPYKITVALAEEDMEKEFEQVYLEVLNLPENLEIEGGMPFVKIKLAGKTKILENYLIAKHIAQIDCTLINQPGEYELPIKYNIPAYFKIIEPYDSSLKINVIFKPDESEE